MICRTGFDRPSYHEMRYVYMSAGKRRTEDMLNTRTPESGTPRNAERRALRMNACEVLQ